MPAPAVIPAPRAYSNVAAFKTLVLVRERKALYSAVIYYKIASVI